MGTLTATDLTLPSPEVPEKSPSLLEYSPFQSPPFFLLTSSPVPQPPPLHPHPSSQVEETTEDSHSTSSSHQRPLQGLLPRDTNRKAQAPGSQVQRGTGSGLSHPLQSAAPGHTSSQSLKVTDPRWVPLFQELPRLLRNTGGETGSKPPLQPQRCF